MIMHVTAVICFPVAFNNSIQVLNGPSATTIGARK
jgi:hypothetical protein